MSNTNVQTTLPFVFFFFNDTATTEIYTLSLHDALPIWSSSPWRSAKRDATPLSVFRTSGSMSSSFLRWIQRSKRTPHTCADAPENRSWESGIRISTVQPSESTVVAASHTASHESSE